MFEPFVAWRYLRAKRKESFISVITGFSLVGIALGVATLIIVMSVMNGFRQELVGRILGINGHMNVYSRMGPMDDYAYQSSELKTIKGVTQALPTIEGQALITFDGAATGVVVRGMSADSFAEKKLLYDAVPRDERGNFHDSNILIGEALAERLRLRVGDNLQLISPRPKQSPFGSMPRAKNFTIGGIFDVGMFEYNNSFIFMPLESAQLFFQMPDRVSFLEIMTTNPQTTLDIEPLISRKLGPDYKTVDWRQNNVNFFSALQVERNVMFLILTLIILIAAFNIISSLIMLVKDKAHDIAILRTMGASKGSILRIFLLTGSSIGAFGTFVGFLIGVLFVKNITAIQKGIEYLSGKSVFPAEIYFLSRVPAQMEWHEVMSIVGMAFGLSFAATLYPAWRAAKLDPVEALRHA
ncbi:MAG TPA: lipoprotein-releasing ABC transporter permease subunit [Alphaproteobacteria bacterium]